jgi:dipeptidyl aminopeptidase/acylaminoacyl peptidase
MRWNMIRQNLGKALAWLFLPAMWLLPGCGTVEFGIESNTPLAPTTAASPSAQPSITPLATPTLATMTPIATPTLSPDIATGGAGDPAPTTSPETFWESAAVSPDLLVPILVGLGEEFGPYGDIATMHADGSAVDQLTHYGYNADPVLSPDRQRIAYRSVPITITSLPEPGPRLYQGFYNIWVITIDGNQAWQLSQSEAVRSVPTWSADSRRVAFSQGDEGQLVVIDVDSQQVLTQGASAPRYRPGSDEIAYITAPGGLARIEPNGDILPIVTADSLADNRFVNDFDWSADGQYLIYTVADETNRRIAELNIGVEYSTWIVPAGEGEPVWLADDVHDIQVSPDGRWLLALQGSGYGDACMVDSRLVFLHLAEDLSQAQIANPDTFAGFPQLGSDQTFYPRTNVTWVAEHLAQAEFGVTCILGDAAQGAYLMDPSRKQMILIGDRR